jgi:hypothetical protein
MFLAGVLVSLTVVKIFGNDAVFDEIVRSVGDVQLLDEATRSGNLRRSGMSDWKRRQAR